MNYLNCLCKEKCKRTNKLGLSKGNKNYIYIKMILWLNKCIEWVLLKVYKFVNFFMFNKFALYQK